MAGLFAKADRGMDMMDMDMDDGDDFAEDLAPPGDEEMPELGAGPFDAYAETVLDAEADPEDRKSALREAILTLIEEKRLG
jgi:hypothetical protein